MPGAHAAGPPQPDYAAAPDSSNAFFHGPAVTQSSPCPRSWMAPSKNASTGKRAKTYAFYAAFGWEREPMAACGASAMCRSIEFFLRHRIITRKPQANTRS